MKKHLKLICFLPAIILFLSCTPKDGSADSKKEEPKEVAVEKLDEKETVDKANEVSNNVDEEKPAPPEKPAWQIEKEKRKELAKEYEKKLEDLMGELSAKRDFIHRQTPSSSIENRLAAGKWRTEFYDYKTKTPFYITVLDLVEEENGIYYGKYKFTTPKGKILEYGINYKKDEKKQEGKEKEFYYLNNIELLSPITEVKTNGEIIEKQVHEEIYDLNNDQNSKEMKKLFEEYENEKYPFNDEKKKLAVLDYVKGNFTGSGYDEYFVMFYEDDGTDIYRDDVVCMGRYRCFIVSEGKIIKEYYINSLAPLHVYGLTPGTGITNYIFEIKDFGVPFSQGWVNDFNQNGKNEIYFVMQMPINYSVLFITEFDGTEFVTDYVSSFSRYVTSVDWETKTINIIDRYPYNYEYPDLPNIQLDTFRWAEDSNEFILIKSEFVLDWPAY